tara:strand:+ start:1289 stop:1675 length:387 start_codon:yes stop_codon:yes gene_type:complete
MSHKSKGINAERQLIHLFWDAGYAAVRVAGSGSTKYPSPDVLASNQHRTFVIEAKTTTDDRKYFPHKEIHELKEFGTYFGAEPWIAIKFAKENWLFINPEDLEKSEKHYTIKKETALRRGLLFEELLK